MRKSSRRSRRHFLRRSVVGAAAVGAIGASAAYAAAYEPHHLTVTRLQIPVVDLPTGLTGLSIGQISDLHLGRFVDASAVHAAFGVLLSLRPDLIVITGDFVTRVSHGEPEAISAELARLSAPLGVFSILGNYDYLADAATVARAVEAGGVKLLRNEGVAIRRGGDQLYLAGIDDVLGGQPDLAAALRDVPALGKAVLLAHEPDFADEAATDRRITLQLSGHSHGGQVRVPILGPLYLPDFGRKYWAGHYRVGAMQLYTNRGIGTVIAPVRFDCPPEITRIELRPA